MFVIKRKETQTQQKLQNKVRESLNINVQPKVKKSKSLMYDKMIANQKLHGREYCSLFLYSIFI